MKLKEGKGTESSKREKVGTFQIKPLEVVVKISVLQTTIFNLSNKSNHRD